MSLPTERYRAVIKARNFLRDLLNPKATPRVPKAIRREAYRVLKHYMGSYDLEKLAKNNPTILQNPNDENE